MVRTDGRSRSGTPPRPARRSSCDANGQTTRVQTPTGNPTSYSWDGAHRLQSATTPANQRFSFSYDHNDRRVKKQGPSATDSFLWDGSDLLARYGPNGINELVSRGTTLARITGHRSGGVNLNRQYHTDALANVEAITDASQTAEMKPSTDAWGNLLSGSATDQPYDFTGGLGYWHDPDLGLQYVRARWLNPATGQWMSPDPVDSEPRYSYAHQMPTTQVDPSGTQSFSGMAAAAFSLSNPVYDYRGRIVGPGDPSLRAALAGYVPPPGRAGYELMGTSPANARLVPIARTPQEAAAMNLQAILRLKGEIAADQVGIFDRAALGILSSFGLSSERAHRVLNFIKELGANVLAGINQFLGMLGGFVKSTTAGFKSFVSKLPQWLKNIAPLEGASNIALYVFGIVAGIVDRFLEAGKEALMVVLRKIVPGLAAVELVAGILETVLYLFQNGVSWEMVFDSIKTAALGPFNALFSQTRRLATAASLGAFDRGREMTEFMTNLILSILHLVNRITQGRDLAKAIKEALTMRAKGRKRATSPEPPNHSHPRDHDTETARNNAVAEEQVNRSRYLYRADDAFRGAPVGHRLNSAQAAAAKIQNFWDHVLHKDPGDDSRYRSLSRSRGGVLKFTLNKRNPRIFKILKEDLERLQAEGAIRIFYPEDVRRILQESDNPRMRKDANNVYQTMLNNNEVIVEGEIPGNLFSPSK